MKKFGILAAAAILSASMAIPALAAEDWEQAYSDIIYQESLTINYNPHDYPYPLEYGLFDIDGNGIPELFVGSWQYKDVYTMKNGNAVKIWYAHDDRTLAFLPNENAFLDGKGSLFAAEGIHWIAKFYLNDGTVTPQKEDLVRGGIDSATILQPQKIEASIEYFDIHEPYSVSCIVKGKKVSENEYEAAKKKLYENSIRLNTYLIENKAWRPDDLENKITKRIVNKQASASSQKLTVNGSPVTAESYLIDGNNYCKLRDIAYILKDTDSCFQVSWSDRENMIVITTGQSYTGDSGKAASGTKTAVSTAADIYIDGNYEQLEGYNIGGSNYFKLRDITAFVGAEANWNSVTKTVNIITPNAPRDTASNGALDAYNAFLQDNSLRQYQFVDKSGWVEVVEFTPDYFCVKDFSGDGQPELLVGKKALYDKEFPDHTANFVAFTYQNGKMVPLDGIEMESYTPYIYLMDGKRIITFQTGSGGLFLWHYYDFANNEIGDGNYDKEFKNYIGCADVDELDKSHLDASAKLEEIKFVKNTAENRTYYLASK